MTAASTPTPQLLSGMEATLGPELFEKVQESKILLVGAGGIGCELLKNLALSGFRHVEVIDLDTIDVSNLNRQFLFRVNHVGMPKCTVASEAALKMVPAGIKAEYIPHHGNVCDNSKFNVQYVSQFNLVLNALDNLVARRRVNRLCLAASVPLVEAGTTGYLGQVTVIDKASNVECYECQPKPTQKVYPICTIRSTPSVPVHTIVWAKELYKLLFGPKMEDSMLYEDPNGEEPSVYMQAVSDFRTLQGSSKDPEKMRKASSQVLSKLYNEEIEKQIEMDRYKTAKKKPKSLSKDDISQGAAADCIPPSRSKAYSATNVWSPVECIAEFTACLQDACAATALLPEFDKDDEMALRFVTAASNLRSLVFGIEPLQSLYAAKGIAGNIIPAIATTNAIVAGLQVLQAFHILKTQLSTKVAGMETSSLKDSCKYIYCAREKTRKGFYLMPTTLPDPNPKCFVCRNATIPLTLDTTKWTLEKLLSLIVKKELGFEEPTIMLEGDIIYEDGEGADSSYQVNLSKVLSTLPCGGIQQGTMVRVEDFSQDLEVDVCVTHKDVWDEEGQEELDEDQKYLVGGDKPKVQEQTTEGKTEGKSDKEEEEDDDDDDIEIVEMDSDAKPVANGGPKENGDLPKRPLEAPTMNGFAKRRKVEKENGSGNAASDAIEIIEIE